MSSVPCTSKAQFGGNFDAYRFVGRPPFNSASASTAAQSSLSI